MASADLLLHPVRLRIVKAFLGDRALTTRQLAAELPDVPAASVYRHVGRLAEAGVLHVVSERRVRGITERTYMLRLYAAQIQPGEIAAIEPEPADIRTGEYDLFRNHGMREKLVAMGCQLIGMRSIRDDLRRGPYAATEPDSPARRLTG